MGEQLSPVDKKMHTWGMERRFSVKALGALTEPGLNYQYQHGGSKQAVVTIPEDPMSPSDL